MDLVLGLLAVKKLLRKRRRHGQFLAWSSQVQWQEILLWVFHSTFWAFLCIPKAPFGGWLWSERHWKDLFLLQKLGIDDANFGQKQWRQKRKKGQGSSRAVTGGTGVNGLRAESYSVMQFHLGFQRLTCGPVFSFSLWKGSWGIMTRDVISKC